MAYLFNLNESILINAPIECCFLLSTGIALCNASCA